MVNILQICDNCGKPTPDNEMNQINGSARLGIETLRVCAACLPSLNNADALKKFKSTRKDTSGETIDVNNKKSSNNITPDDSRQKQNQNQNQKKK